MTSSRDVDGGWAWVVLAASYFNIFLCSGLGYLAGVYQVVFLEQFDGSVALTAWVTSLFSALMQLAGPLSSALSNRYSCRVSVMLGGCLAAGGLFISGLANDLGVLLFSFGLVAGTGLGLIYTSSIVIVSFYFDKRRRLVNGIALSAGGLGFILTPQVIRVLFEHLSWRESLAVMAGVAANAGVAGALMFSIHETRSNSSNNHICRCCSSHSYSAIGFFCRKNCACFGNDDTDTQNGSRARKCERNSKGVDCGDDYGDDCGDDNVEERELKYLVDDDDDDGGSGGGDGGGGGGGGGGGNQCAMMVDDESNALLSNNDNDKKCSNKVVYDPESTDKPCYNISHDPGRIENEIIIKQSDVYENARYKLPNYKCDDDVRNDDEKSEKSDNIFQNYPEEEGTTTTITSRIKPQPSSMISSSPSLSSLPRDSEIAIKTTTTTTTSPTTTSKTSLAIEDLPFPKLYKNRLFWVLCLSLFVSNAGCGVFNIHVPSFLKSERLSEKEVTNVLSMNGLAILCGRCLVGVLANSLPGHDLLLFMIMHVIGGLFMCMMPVLGRSYLPNLLIIFGIGSYAGSVYTVLPTLTIQLVGLERLATAFGIEMVCAGAGYLMSPPLAGLLVDLTNGYEYNILCGGLLFIVAGLILMVIPRMKNYK